MKRRRAGAQRDSVLAAYILGKFSLDGVDIRTNGADLISADRFVHKTLFVSMHSGRRKPNLVFERHNFFKS